MTINKMEIREATREDIPKIVILLKQSLGESLLPKSEEVWRYKHLDNPFGESLVLVAVIDNEIVGVRAYMRWSWRSDSQNFEVYRAVDTGVLPQYQGQGIFTKLNLAAVDLSRERENHFIFNTPNSQSLPGNLKMGWKEIQKINIRLVPSKPYHLVYPHKKPEYEITKMSSKAELGHLLEDFNAQQKKEGKFFTPKTPEYLHWRYEENPLQEYEVLTDKDFYLAGYVKDHKYFTELRITEHIFKNKEGLNKVRRYIKAWSKKFKTPVISYSPDVKIYTAGFSGNFGPILTFRNLNLSGEAENKLMKLPNWKYSLGDLELF